MSSAPAVLSIAISRAPNGCLEKDTSICSGTAGLPRISGERAAGGSPGYVSGALARVCRLISENYGASGTVIGASSDEAVSRSFLSRRGKALGPDHLTLEGSE